MSDLTFEWEMPEGCIQSVHVIYRADEPKWTCGDPNSHAYWVKYSPNEPGFLLAQAEHLFILPNAPEHTVKADGRWSKYAQKMLWQAHCTCGWRSPWWRENPLTTCPDAPERSAS